MLKKVIVLGAGSAGLLAALTLKRRLKHLQVTVVYSEKIGIIGVGEGTTPYVPLHIHGYLGMDREEFQREVKPVWKLGIEFEWGKRGVFHYSFSNQQTDFQWQGLKKPNGYYAFDRFDGADLPGALMKRRIATPMGDDGKPDIPPPGVGIAWHLENHRFVQWLHKACMREGVKFIEGKVEDVELQENGEVKRLLLDGGRRVAGEMFIDASGFRAELMNKLGAHFDSFTDALFCDKAVVGGWEREDETILPCTRSEQMPHGWSWRIDHPDRINRGYVYSSSFVSDHDAEQAFREANPKIKDTRLVHFRSGRYRDSWIKNVVGIGNASGFVEPLEASAIMVICIQSRALTDCLYDCDGMTNDSLRKSYNKLIGGAWDDIRDFLALHYKYNTALDTPFWQECREKVNLGKGQDVADFYQQNGPSLIAKEVLMNAGDPYGMEGYLTLLVGMQVPHKNTYTPTAEEWKLWENYRNHFSNLAENGVGMKGLLEYMKKPGWAG
ncbi:tryptophan halogenase [Rubritalea squalenifaciens DSM 18772]|uniref:Tryptophan halogenase n=1 Tax=Rubritalea squalenifaciens DSM 18772 TaxID=1123071 RepID=A0A1M6AX62_9BACT|nr:FAD-dependent oxidoreductase [Rubritalea squalenifaciens]SHI41001.1 tryptophan halogenase [Rubritalea squalenifaciens DSM 18772]